MRQTLRLLANVKPAAAAARYLQVGNPTGLTGLFTHSSPRSTLLYLYSSTLEKLQRFPESSLYRKSVEAQTKHRMAIVEAVVPPGYEEWAGRAREIVDANPAEFTIASHLAGGANAVKIASAGALYVHRNDPMPVDLRYEEWDGEKDEGEGAEGLRGPEEREDPGFDAAFARVPLEMPGKIKWEAEPQLTADQIEEVENKIGAGLIEEVVQVAESELKLVDILYEAKVWEGLEEKPAPGQWEYFDRSS